MKRCNRCKTSCNRLLKRLPQAVQTQGVTVSKTGDTNLMMVAFVSTDGSMDKQDIADYVASNIQDPLSRMDGVGSIDAYGSQYAMRIWLDPDKLTNYQMTTADVVDCDQSAKQPGGGRATWRRAIC